MGKDFHSLEEMFRTQLEHREQTPSPDVLRKLKKRLWWSDFFGYNPRKINIGYTTLALAGVTVLLLNTVDWSEEAAMEETFAEENLIEEVVADEVLAYNEKVSEKIPEPVYDDIARAILSARFEAEALQGCAPFTVQFKDKSAYAKNWKWKFGNGKSSTLRNPKTTFHEPGTYSVTLTVKDETKATATHTKTIKVLESPVADLDIDVEGSDMALRKVLFKNKSKGGNTYTWDFGDANLDNKPQTAEHVYADFGVYPVHLIAEAENGCRDTATLLNNFLETDYTLYFPLNFRPNPYERNNGLYESAGSSSGIFYPENAGVDNYQLKVFLPNGQEAFSTNNIKQGWNGYIRGRIAPAGYYRYEASGTYPNGQTFSYRSTVRVIVDPNDFY